MLQNLNFWHYLFFLLVVIKVIYSLKKRIIVFNTGSKFRISFIKKRRCLLIAYKKYLFYSNYLFVEELLLDREFQKLMEESLKENKKD